MATEFLPALDATRYLIHERLRLGIVSALAGNESLTFRDLKALLNVSDGNLSIHTRKLDQAGYLNIAKSFEGRQPQTAFRLTEAGHQALENYLTNMTKLVRQIRRSKIR